MKSLAPIVAVLALAACKPASEPKAPAAPVAQASARFQIEPLQEADQDIQGCSRTLDRVGATNGIGLFLENAVDTGAFGYIRIDGTKYKVDLLTADQIREGEKEVRTFADPTKTVTVIETLTSGAQHPDSDSVEESGTLSVTYKDLNEIVPVEGGTAC